MSLALGSYGCTRALQIASISHIRVRFPIANNLRMLPKPLTFLSAQPLPRFFHPRRSLSSPPLCSASLPSEASSLTAAADAVRTGATTATALLEAALARIEATDPSVNAYLTVDVSHASNRAAQIDKLHASGTALGPLAGVPIAIKDNICTKHLVTTAASRILDGFVPSYDATVIQRLQAAGAVLLGKTNLDEFGMGSSTENSAYGATKNPWDLDRVPGGSSGGSAAAVAARTCIAALGSDTGGSVRQPASFCGVTGMKPSYGRVSRHGLLAYASSLDTIGPICTSVRDAALLLQIIAGEDAMDSTTVRAPVPEYSAQLHDGADLTGVTVGVIEEAMDDGVHADVSARVKEAIHVLRRLGAKVKSVSLPRLAVSTAAYYVLAPSEASANLARYDGVRYGVRDTAACNSSDMYARSRAKGFGEEVKRRIMVGTFALSSGYYDAYYLRAQRVRALMARDFKNAFANDVDVLVSPVAPTPAFKIDEKIEDPVSMFLDDIMTIPASQAGLPALSVPCGFSETGLPIGMQIIGPFLEESRVFQVGHAFQMATDHHLQTADVPERLTSAAA